MNQTSSTRFFMLSASILVSTLSLSLGSTVHAAEHQQACSDNIQRKIAWNDSGNTEWKTENLERLCANTTKPAEPGSCFKRVMTEHVNWGVGDTWKWENALNLCAGTDNAEDRIGCFKKRIEAKEAWQEAIFQCQRSGKPVS